MAEIIAGIVFIIMGMACLAVAFLSLLTEADAAAFGADAGMGLWLAGSSIGALGCFGLAAWLFFF